MREADWQTPDGRVKLFLGDCIDLLPTLPKVDACITDPPYAVPAAHYIGKRAEATPKRVLSELSILEHFFRQVGDTLPEVAMYWFCDGQSYPVLFRAFYSKWKYVRPIIWDKMTSYNGYTWRHQHELIAWCESATCERVPTGDGDIIQCRAVPVDERMHPAEKPVSLLMDLVRKTAGAVLDPFMGSCSTGAACVRLGRPFVGIEAEPRYFDIAVSRIQREIEQGTLAFPEPERYEAATLFAAD